jgi:VanZ family protein
VTAESKPNPYFRILHAIVLAASLVLWTGALLDPNPVPPRLQPEEWLKYFLAKSLHVCGYGWCTILGLLLFPALTHRIIFVSVMVWHAIATEIIQSYIPTRTGTPHDVGFDCAGITLACLVVWWRHSRR